MSSVKGALLPAFFLYSFIPNDTIPFILVVERILHTSSLNANIVTMSNIDAEDAQFQNEVEEVKQWWSGSRWRFTRRPFKAEDIVSKRGNLKITYPSNSQSKKLWEIVEGRFKGC